MTDSKSSSTPLSFYWTCVKATPNERVVSHPEVLKNLIREGDIAFCHYSL